MTPTTREEAIRLVIADDQPVVRAGLRMLLEGEPGFEVVSETADIPATVRALAAQRVDAVVIDTHIPGELGIAAVPQLVQASPETAVVILTMQDDPGAVREALRAGARGYVLKHSAGIELIDAVHAAVAGETYLNPILGARMAAEPSPSARQRDSLTDRETEVLRLIALGHTNTEIAQQLYLSVRTVESHRAHIQQKLRLSRRSDLVRYALDHDLIDH